MPISDAARTRAGRAIARAEPAARGAAVDEDVVHAVLIETCEVITGVRERAAITRSRNRHREHVLLGLRDPVPGNEELRRPRRAIAAKNVAFSVPIVGSEVGRCAREHGEATIGGEDRSAGTFRALRTDGRHVDAIDRSARAIEDESIARSIRVALNEVLGRAREARESPVARHNAEVRPTVRNAAARAAHEERRHPRPAIAHENVHRSVRVTGDQVRRHAPEEHVAAVSGGERGQCSRAAHVVALDARGGDADALEGPEGPVEEEDVAHGVRVERDQVGRPTHEEDVTRSAGERRSERGSVTLDAAGTIAHALDRAGHSIAHEHVERAVHVARHEVRGRRVERDEAPIVGEDGVRARRVALDAAGTEVHALDRVGAQVGDEDVCDAVRVARDEVRRGGDEDDVATIGRDRRLRRSTIAFDAGRVEAHAFDAAGLREHARSEQRQQAEDRARAHGPDPTPCGRPRRRGTRGARAPGSRTRPGRSPGSHA